MRETTFVGPAVKNAGQIFFIFKLHINAKKNLGMTPFRDDSYRMRHPGQQQIVFETNKITVGAKMDFFL